MFNCGSRRRGRRRATADGPLRQRRCAARQDRLHDHGQPRVHRLGVAPVHAHRLRHQSQLHRVHGRATPVSDKPYYRFDVKTVSGPGRLPRRRRRRLGCRPADLAHRSSSPTPTRTPSTPSSPSTTPTATPTIPSSSRSTTWCAQHKYTLFLTGHSHLYKRHRATRARSSIGFGGAPLAGGNFWGYGTVARAPTTASTSMSTTADRQRDPRQVRRRAAVAAPSYWPRSGARAHEPGGAHPSGRRRAHSVTVRMAAERVAAQAGIRIALSGRMRLTTLACGILLSSPAASRPAYDPSGGGGTAPAPVAATEPAAATAPATAGAAVAPDRGGGGGVAVNGATKSGPIAADDTWSGAINVTADVTSIPASRSPSPRARSSRSPPARPSSSRATQSPGSAAMPVASSRPAMGRMERHRGQRRRHGTSSMPTSPRLDRLHLRHRRGPCVADHVKVHDYTASASAFVGRHAQLPPVEKGGRAASSRRRRRRHRSRSPTRCSTSPAATRSSATAAT